MQEHDDHIGTGQSDDSVEPPVSRERRAPHEAGHAVVLYTMGVRANSVSIKQEGSVLGVTRWDNFLDSWKPDSAKAPDAAKAAAIVLFAGQSAERRLGEVHEVEIPDHDQGWENDNAEAMRFLSAHCIDHGGGEVPPDLEPELRRKSDELVEAHWEQIEKMAARLLDKDMIYTGDIIAIMAPEEAQRLEELAASFTR